MSFRYIEEEVVVAKKILGEVVCYFFNILFLQFNHLYQEKSYVSRERKEFFEEVCKR